jgi:AcrR family transcriptional regulator
VVSRRTDTGAAIEEAATDLFFEFGYHATTMRQIAARANVQAPAIYHWYPSKEVILVKLQDDFMRDLSQAVDAAVDQQSDPVFQLAAAVREHVVFHCMHAREAFVTDSEIRALSRERRRALIAKRDAYQQYFHQKLVRGIDAGTLHSAEPLVATYAILLQATGVAMWFQPGGRLTAAEVADLQVELTLGALHAGERTINAALKAIRTEPATAPRRHRPAFAERGAGT